MVIPISELMTTCVEWIGMDESAAKAEEVMQAHKLTSMPVLDNDGKIFGIISATDLIRLHALKRNANSVRVWEICTHAPITVNMDSPVHDVAALMLMNHIHHIVIADAGKIKGIVSSLDFVRQLLSNAALHDL